MITTIFRQGVHLVSEFARVMDIFFTSFFELPVSNVLRNWRENSLETDGILQPIYNWLTDAIIDIPLFTNNTLADLLLGAGVTALIGFTIVRSLLSIIR